MKLFPVLVLSAAAWSAHATSFKLVPLTLDNGYTVKGTIETDGTAGSLVAANIVNWNIQVTQTTDVVYTNAAFTPGPNEATTVVVTGPPEVSGVSTNGKRIFVERSPDTANFADGGSLLFRGPGLYEPNLAQVADFTYSSSWFYPDSIIGGVGGWVTPIAGYAFAAPMTTSPCSAAGVCSKYAAANAISGQANVFRLIPLTVQAANPLQTLSGTVTTDGTVGPLAAGNFTAWRITGRTQDIQTYTPANSVVRNVAYLSSDNVTLKLAGNPNGNLGILDIGTARTVNNPGISINLGDFTDPAMYPGGVASYSLGNFGLAASKTPLTARKTYVVARAQ